LSTEYGETESNESFETKENVSTGHLIVLFIGFIFNESLF